MEKIHSLCERYGGVLMALSIVVTLFVAFCYDIDFSNPDFFYYMHLVSNGNCHKEPFIAGTILLSKPLIYFFDHKLWMWKLFAWAINAITIILPTCILLERQQWKKYAYIVAMALVVCEVRFGLEPPKFVYLFYVLLVVCFLKYLQKDNILFLASVAILLALISFIRFPSLFVWPVFVFAFVILKRKWIHSVLVVVMPLVIYILLITVTNGSAFQFLSDVAANFSNTASGDHSLSNIFLSEVKTTVLAGLYTFFMIAPLAFYHRYRMSGKDIYEKRFWVCLIIIASILLIHPTPHHCCALAITTAVLYCASNKLELQRMIITCVIIVAAMFCSVGSDYGFVHDYLAVAFVPFLLANTFEESGKYVVEKGDDKHFSSKRCKPVLSLVVCFLFIARLIAISNDVRNNYFVDGKGGFIDAGVVSENYKYMIISNRHSVSMQKIQKKIDSLKSHNDVIFWGKSSHEMSFANDIWPVTDEWDITSKEMDGRAYRDLKAYVEFNSPIVIDLEKHENTEELLLSLGYKQTKEDGFIIYEKD